MKSIRTPCAPEHSISPTHPGCAKTHPCSLVSLRRTHAPESARYFHSPTPSLDGSVSVGRPRFPWVSFGGKRRYATRCKLRK